MGLTIGCAQCHEHKFDPFSQRDYYRLYAVFNSTADNNDAGGLAPKIDLPTAQQAAERQRFKDVIAGLNQQKTAREGELLEIPRSKAIYPEELPCGKQPFHRQYLVVGK